MRRYFLSGVLTLFAATCHAATPITGYVQTSPPISPQPGAFNISSGTVGQLGVTSLSPGGCVSASAGAGILTDNGLACGSGGGGSGVVVSSPNYTQSFSNATSVVLNHYAGSFNILIECYNNQSPPQLIEPDKISLTDANHATVTFMNAQSGSCIVNATSGYNFPSVRDFGAKCDGSTDDTAAIQAAVNSVGIIGGELYFPAGNCIISSSITLVRNIILQGQAPLIPTSTGTTTITQNSAAPIFSFPVLNTGNTGEYPHITINNFHLIGGTDQIFTKDGAIWTQINTVNFDGPSFACLHWQGSIQHWFVRDSRFSGGNYGIYLSTQGVDVNGNAGSTAGLDGNTFENLEFDGQTINGIYIDLGIGSGNFNSFSNIGINNAMQDGAIFGHGLTGLILENFSMESNGHLSHAPYGFPVEGSTATTSVGFSTVTVGTTVGLTVGDTVTIAGAGTNGMDWYPFITAIFPSSITVNATAPTTVNSVEITNYLYSDVKFTAGVMATFKNFSGGSFNNSAATRYAIDASGLSDCIIENTSLGRPIYDPSALCTTIGSNASSVYRRPPNLTTESFFTSYFGGHYPTPRTQVASPAGGDIIMGLSDSTLNGLGTFGNFSIVKSDSGKTKVLQVNSGSGQVTASGPISTTGWVQPGSLTHAQINATVPVGTGQIYMCTDCAAVLACVSTGTLVNQWALITNKGLACQ